MRTHSTCYLQQLAAPQLHSGPCLQEHLPPCVAARHAAHAHSRVSNPAGHTPTRPPGTLWYATVSARPSGSHPEESPKLSRPLDRPTTCVRSCSSATVQTPVKRQVNARGPPFANVHRSPGNYLLLWLRLVNPLSLRVQAPALPRFPDALHGFSRFTRTPVPLLSPRAG